MISLGQQVMRNGPFADTAPSLQSVLVCRSNVNAPVYSAQCRFLSCVLARRKAAEHQTLHGIVRGSFRRQSPPPRRRRTSPRYQSSSCQARFPNATLGTRTLAFAHAPRACPSTGTRLPSGSATVLISIQSSGKRKKPFLTPASTTTLRTVWQENRL